MRDLGASLVLGLLILLPGLGMAKSALADGHPGLVRVGKEMCHVPNRGAFPCLVYRNEAGRKYYFMNGFVIDEDAKVVWRFT